MIPVANQAREQTMKTNFDPLALLAKAEEINDAGLTDACTRYYHAVTYPAMDGRDDQRVARLARRVTAELQRIGVAA